MLGNWEHPHSCPEDSGHFQDRSDLGHGALEVVFLRGKNMSNEDLDINVGTPQMDGL